MWNLVAGEEHNALPMLLIRGGIQHNIKRGNLMCRCEQYVSNARVVCMCVRCLVIPRILHRRRVCRVQLSRPIRSITTSRQCLAVGTIPTFCPPRGLVVLTALHHHLGISNN